jgi:hypothetical protein
MIRALSGLILGALLLAVLAAVYGKWQEMPARDFEPVLLVALAAGAVLGLAAGLLSARRRG